MMTTSSASIKYVIGLAVLLTVWIDTGLTQDFEYQQSPRPAPARLSAGFSAGSAASNAQRPTPVPILKQINRHNEDGSYTYGYEGADGSFKIETKQATGEVKGKYGYVDDTGKLRVVEYGATKYGFEPSGEGITVAPPTLVDETTDKDGNVKPEYSGSYYQNDGPQPQTIPARIPIPQLRSRPRPAPIAYEQQQRSAPISYDQPQYVSAPESVRYAHAPQPSPAPVPARIPQIPGALPGPSSQFAHHEFDFGAPSRPAAPAPRPIQYSRPAPIQEDHNEADQQIRTAPRITYAQPLSLPKSAPQQYQVPVQRPAQNTHQRSGGFLDELAKAYALPQGGSTALHDISFGYY